MDEILQELLGLQGVGAAMVLDAGGQLAGHRGQAVYDRAFCEQLAAPLRRSVDAVALHQQDWEFVLAQFADGKLLLRSIATTAGTHVLVLVADATLNPSFATVAIRVAAAKLRKAIEGGAASSQLASAGRAAPAGAVPPPLPPQAAADSQPLPGAAWSQGSSSVRLSRVQVADPASAALLTRFTKELARHVGPMAKVYVEEAVQKVCPSAPFSLAFAGKLVEELSGQIEDADDRAQFRKAIAKV
ncbi:MAG: roadblock/LC7 domain-containing protein [Anaeromyxobacter sp.]